MNTTTSATRIERHTEARPGRHVWVVVARKARSQVTAMSEARRIIEAEHGPTVTIKSMWADPLFTGYVVQVSGEDAPCPEIDA